MDFYLNKTKISIESDNGIRLFAKSICMLSIDATCNQIAWTTQINMEVNALIPFTDGFWSRSKSKDKICLKFFCSEKQYINFWMKVPCSCDFFKPEKLAIKIRVMKPTSNNL